MNRIKALFKVFKKPNNEGTKRFSKFWPAPNSKDIPLTIFETDDEFNHLYNEAQSKTQMENTDNAYRRQRHYTLYYLFKNVLKTETSSNVNIAEVGCWRGLSAFQTSDSIKKSGKNITFHVFDSFEGLSEFTSKDNSLTISAEEQEKVRKVFAYEFEKVRENLNQFEFIKYYKGWVPSRFNEVESNTFSFVHIDVDMYDPTYDCIKFFYPRLRSKGIIVFDDYGATTFLGAQKAVDDYLSTLNKEEFFFINLPSTQAFLIKN